MEQVDARMAAVPHVHLLGHAYRGVGVNECIKHGSRLAERLGAG